MKKIFYILATVLAVSGGLGANEDFEGIAERFIEGLNNGREIVVVKSLSDQPEIAKEGEGYLDQKGMINVQRVEEGLEECKALIEKAERCLA